MVAQFLHIPLILSAERRGPSELWEFAPVIIIVAISILGTIGKAIRKKSEQQRGGQQKKPKAPQAELPLDLEAIIRRAKQRYQEAQGKPPALKPVPPVPAPLSVAKSAAQMPAPPQILRVQSIAQPPPVPALVTQPSATEITQASIEKQLQVEPSEGRAVVDESAAANPYLDELLEDLHHPQSFRKIILYAEILGAPVGIRDADPFSIE